MKNNYGNFVVQKALKLSSGLTKMNLLSSIIKSIEKIGDKKIMAKWESIVNGHILQPQADMLLENHTLGLNQIYRSTNIQSKGKSKQLLPGVKRNSNPQFSDGLLKISTENL